MLLAGFVPLDALAEMVSIGTLFAFFVVSIAVVVLRRTRPQMKRPFRTPQVPLLPIVSAVCCVGLMTNLALETWLRFLVWLVIGLVDLLVLRPHALPARARRGRAPAALTSTGTRRRSARCSAGRLERPERRSVRRRLGRVRSRSGARRSSPRARPPRPPSRSPTAAGRAGAAGRTVASPGQRVQHRGHPPGEVRAPPDPAQGVVGVGVDQRRADPSTSQAVSARASRVTSAIARFSPLAPVGGTMCAASPARNSRPCRIGVATKLRIGSTLFSVIGPCCSDQPSWPCPSRVASAVPDPVVGPLRDVLVGRHLEVEPRDRRRAHRVQREAVRVPGVDQLVGRRRHVGEHAEPGVGVGPLPGPSYGVRDAPSRRAVEAVAAGDRVGLDALRARRPASVKVTDGRSELEVVQRDVGDLVEGLPAGRSRGPPSGPW